MNDDVKAAIEWLRDVVRLAKRDGDRVNYAHEENLLAHIDGFDARLTAAREEQREACRVTVAAIDCDCPEFADNCASKRFELFHDGRAAEVASEVAGLTPLTAQPLADEITALRAQIEKARETNTALRARVAELEGANRYLVERLDAAGDLLQDLEKAEAERDALRARDVSDHPGGALLVAEVASLRAQVEAGRRKALYFLNDTVTSVNRACREILDAMDEAKPSTR